MSTQANKCNAQNFLKLLFSIEGCGLATPFMYLVSVAHTVHRLWLYYRFGVEYANPDHQSLLVIGQAIHFLAKDHKALQRAAKTLLVSRLIMEWVAIARKCTVAYRKWQRALILEELMSEQNEWKRQSLSSVWLEKAALRAGESVGKAQIATKCFFSFLQKLFLLFLQSLDMLCAYSTREQDLWIHSRHLFVNGYKTLKLFHQESDLIVQQLRINNSALQGLYRLLGIGNSLNICVSALCKTITFFQVETGVQGDVFESVWLYEHTRKEQTLFSDKCQEQALGCLQS